MCMHTHIRTTHTHTRTHARTHTHTHKTPLTLTWNGSVMAGVERGTPRLLPEGGYTFENPTRLTATLVLIADGQVCMCVRAVSFLLF